MIAREAHKQASSDQQSPLVSIVIVNYKTPKLTVECVRSLARLEYANVNIVVVDNASGDDSVSVIQEQLPAIDLVVAKANGGYTAGNNLGIQRALANGADFVLILNPDTVLLNPDFLSVLVEHMQTHPTVGAAGPKVFLHSPTNVQNTVLRFPWLYRRVVDWVRSRFVTISRRSGDQLIDAEVLNGVCVLFRRSCLEKVGLFDERTFAYIEDVEWAYRAEKCHWKRHYVPVDSILHLQKKNGYERGSNVDFLLKRNTLYFLLLTRHWLQALGYTFSTLFLALGQRLLSTFSGETNSNMKTWTSRLLRSYLFLWRRKYDIAMGKPEC